MSNVIEQAEEFRKRAIDLLLTERAAIDERLAMLSYDGAEMPNTSSNRKRACGLCGSADHNARRCPKNDSAASPSETIP